MNHLMPQLSSPLRLAAVVKRVGLVASALALGTLLACNGTTPAEPETGTPEGPAPEAPAPDGPAPEGPTPEGPSPEGPSPEGPTPEPIPGAITPSLSPKVKFMGGARLRAALAGALSISEADVCKELGVFDCVDFVHKISLGGVDAEYARIDEPFKTAPIATPIAVDRLTLNACALRSERDFATPADAVVFSGLASSSTGLADTAAIHADMGVLFQRVLRRSPTEEDLTRLDALATETLGTEGVAAADAPQTFATLACFVAASSMENLFY